MQDSDLTRPCLLLPTDRREVKVGEYNAVADTLEIINDTIRFQGKAGGLLRGGGLLRCSQTWILSEAWEKAHRCWLHEEEGVPSPLNPCTHPLRTGPHHSQGPGPGIGHRDLHGVLALPKASVFKSLYGQE